MNAVAVRENRYRGEREMKIFRPITFGLVYGLFLLFIIKRYSSTSSVYAFYSIPLPGDTIHIPQIDIGVLAVLIWSTVFLKKEPNLSRFGLCTLIALFIVEIMRA